MESWYLEFTDDQIEALDLWEQAMPGFWFSEASTGVYEIFKRENYSLLLYPNGKVKEENRLINYYSNLETFFENE